MDAMLSALGLSRVALAGHSMGGAVALRMAARRGARVDRLILCDGACYPPRLPLEGRLALLPGLGPLLFRYVYGARDLRRYFAKRVYEDPSALDEDLVAYYWRRVSEHRDATYAALRTVASADGLADLATAVACPTLVLWGERDRIFPLAHGERLAREIPGARLEVLAGCGHAPAEEQPQRFTDAVARFLA
jgi:pimeloyl-ACP methyl ester carboxylesterase